MSDSLHYAFEPFGTLAGVLNGQPIKIMPVGTFYRDNRKLVITPERLQSFAANLKAGLPRFKVPINENHAGVGKVGTVSEVAYLEEGPDGAGLYATGYELTEAGRKLITDKRFDAVSPETVWTLNDGAQYLDPTTGKKHDNVLVGLALTDRPFFGHDNVALFSDSPAARRHNGFTKLKEKMKTQFEDWLKDLADEQPAETPAEVAPEPAAVEAANVTGVKTMEPEKPVTPAVEQFSISKEQFDAMQADLAAAKTNAEKMAADLATATRARRYDQLAVQAEKFSAIPVDAPTLAEKFQAIEDADPKLYEWFVGLLTTLDNAITTGGLFAQMGNGRKPEAQSESLDGVAQGIIKEKFGGDMAHYAEAVTEAGKRRPDLAQAFAAGQKD